MSGIRLEVEQLIAGNDRIIKMNHDSSPKKEITIAGRHFKLGMGVMVCDGSKEKAVILQIRPGPMLKTFKVLVAHGIDYYDADHLLLPEEKKKTVKKNGDKIKAQKYAELIMELGDTKLVAERFNVSVKSIYEALARSEMKIRDILEERKKLINKNKD